jgi:hypothetical protein
VQNKTKRAATQKPARSARKPTPDNSLLFGAIPNVLYRATELCYLPPGDKTTEEIANRELLDKLPLAIHLFELSQLFIRQAALAMGELQHILLPIGMRESVVICNAPRAESMYGLYKELEPVLSAVTSAADLLAKTTGTFFDAMRDVGDLDFDDDMQEAFNAELRSKLVLPGGAQ